MHFSLVTLLACVVLTYGVSRLLLRVSAFPSTALGRFQVHLASTGLIVLADVLLKYSSSGFLIFSPVLVVAAQIVWLGIDTKRGRVPAAA